MKAKEVYVADEYIYDIHAIDRNQLGLDVELNKDTLIASDFTSEDLAKGYALAIAEYADFTDVFVIEVHKVLNNWTSDGVEETNQRIIWSCSVPYQHEDEMDDEIEEETNELVDTEE